VRKQIKVQAGRLPDYLIACVGGGSNMMGLFYDFLDDPKIKSSIASQVLPLIDDLPNPIERDTFRQRLARLLRVSERTLLASTPFTSRHSTRKRRSKLSPSEDFYASFTPSQTSIYSLERHCLGILMRQPSLLYKIDRNLQEARLSRFSPDDFQHADHQSVVKILVDSVDQDLADPQNFVFIFVMILNRQVKIMIIISLF